MLIIQNWGCLHRGSAMNAWDSLRSLKLWRCAFLIHEDIWNTTKTWTGEPNSANFLGWVPKTLINLLITHTHTHILSSNIFFTGPSQSPTSQSMSTLLHFQGWRCFYAFQGYSSNEKSMHLFHCLKFWWPAPVPVNYPTFPPPWLHPSKRRTLISFECAIYDWT